MKPGDNPADSIPPGHVIAGRVIQAHGVTGRIRIQVLSAVTHRFDVGQTIHIGAVPFRIAGSSPSGFERALLFLDGVSTRDQAQALAGFYITVPETDAPPLGEGEYFHFQLLGLRVVTDEGEELGRIAEILETGSNDVYVISGPGGETLAPALADVVREVRLDEGVMIVNLPDGLR